MDYNKKIQELEEEIRIIKIKQHNEGMKGISKSLHKEVKESITLHEDKFFNISKLKGLNLKRQYKIDIVRKKDGYIERFYFVDFCDIKNKIVFEIDGEYHNTKEQIRRDKKRTNDLNKMGYTVFRITNTQIIEGKTTQFIFDSYRSKGIKI